MKILKLFLFGFFCFSAASLYAQTTAGIEAKLLKSFKKIGYWDEKRANDKAFNSGFEDSLDKANTDFGKQLKYYVEKFPFTIDQKFTSLTANNLIISTSTDGLFRIYSWDTEGGGTMREFENVFQYKSGDRTYATIDTPKTEGDFRPAYNQIFTFKVGDKTYYIMTFMFIESTRYLNKGVQIFSIENGHLNDKVKLIKTHTGLHSQLNYEYDFGSVTNEKKQSIHFDPLTNCLFIPIVQSKGQMTNNFITYKFTGKYFEKVKP